MECVRSVDELCSGTRLCIACKILHEWGHGEASAAMFEFAHRGIDFDYTKV